MLIISCRSVFSQSFFLIFRNFMHREYIQVLQTLLFTRSICYLSTPIRKILINLQDPLGLYYLILNSNHHQISTIYDPIKYQRFDISVIYTGLFNYFRQNHMIPKVHKNHLFCNQQKDSLTINSSTSLKTISTFDDDYHQKQTQKQTLLSHSKTSKNHILVKMSARVNGKELSRNEMKSNSVQRDFQQDTQICLFSKINSFSKNSNQMKSSIQNSSKQREVGSRQQGRKRMQFLNSIFIKSNQNRSQNNSQKCKHLNYQHQDDYGIINRREPATTQQLSVCTNTQAKSRLIQTIQINLDLQKRISILQLQISHNILQIQDIKRQNQIQYEILKRSFQQKLRGHELLQMTMKQQIQKLKGFQQRVLTIERQKSSLITTIEEYANENKELTHKLKDQQEKLKSSSILFVRLEYCQNKLKYYEKQLQKQRCQTSFFKNQLAILSHKFTKLQKQIHKLILKPTCNIYSEIVLLSNSFYFSSQEYQKQAFKNHYQHFEFKQSDGIKINKNKKQKAYYDKKSQQSQNNLLHQSNNQLMKLRLYHLNKSIQSLFL